MFKVFWLLFKIFFSTFLSFGTHKMLQTLSGEEGDQPKGSLNYNAEHFFVCLFVLNCSRIPLQANIFKAVFTPDNFDINDVLYSPFP